MRMLTVNVLILMGDGILCHSLARIIRWETERLRDAMERELADAKAQHFLRHQKI